MQFTLSGPQPGFLLNMGDPFTVACAILSQKAGPSNLSSQMVGTGPFSLVSYSPNHQLVFKRFNGYWGKKAGVPNLTIAIVPDPAAQLVALSSGKAGLIFPDSSIVKALQSETRKIKLGSVISATNLRVEFSASKPPFDDVNVRRAVELAVDKTAAVNGTYLGYGAPATYIPSAYSWGPAASAYTYAGKHNVAMAKQLLAQAGYPNGFTTSFMYTTNITSIPRFALVFQSQLAAIGITLTLNPVDTPTYLANLGAANYGLAFNQYPFFADPSLYVTPRPNRNGPVPAQIQQLVSNLSTAIDDPAVLPGDQPARRRRRRPCIPELLDCVSDPVRGVSASDGPQRQDRLHSGMAVPRERHLVLRCRDRADRRWPRGRRTGLCAPGARLRRSPGGVRRCS